MYLSVCHSKNQDCKPNRVGGAAVAKIRTPWLSLSQHSCLVLLLYRRTTSCPRGMRWERMGFDCSKWDLLLWQKLSRMKYAIRLLMGFVATPSLQVFKDMLEKHLLGMIDVELLLPWGMEMDTMTSGGPFQPCFLWALIQDFSLLISWSPKGDRTITLQFYPYTIFFAGWFLLIQGCWLQLHLSYDSPTASIY